MNSRYHQRMMPPPPSPSCYLLGHTPWKLTSSWCNSSLYTTLPLHDMSNIFNNLDLIASSSLLIPSHSITHYSSIWEVERRSTMPSPLLASRRRYYCNFELKLIPGSFLEATSTVATPLWPSVGVKPNTWKSWELESSGTPECSELDSKGQNTSHWGVLGVVGKVLKRRYRKCPRISNSDICSPSYGQKKGRE
jgi:hypothetical protein